MRVIVLAAGKGERLRPLTDNIPKCLIELHPGLKLIDLQLRAMSSVRAIDNAVFIVGYRGEQVEAYLEGWDDKGIEDDKNNGHDVPRLPDPA